MDRQTAVELNQILVDCYAKLHQSIVIARGSCNSDEEFRAYCVKVAMALGYMLLDLMDPIYREHPDLEPEWIK